MNGIKDLLTSERGVFSIALVVGVTVLTGIGQITAEQWIDYTKWIAAFLIAGKTITTAVEAFSNRTPAPTVVPPSSASSTTVNVDTKPAGGS